MYTGLVKNVTLSADERDIEAARDRARNENSTLNEQFRRWLASYGRTADPVADFDRVLGSVQGQLSVGRRLSRDEMNER